MKLLSRLFHGLTHLCRCAYSKCVHVSVCRSLWSALDELWIQIESGDNIRYVYGHFGHQSHSFPPRHLNLYIHPCFTYKLM